MTQPASITLRTNLADYAVTKALKDGRIQSPVVALDCRGPQSAHEGFKPMIRDNAFDAGELALVTYLQAKAYGKPWVLLPVSVSGRQQHHCIVYNNERGTFTPKDLEGREVGVRTYSQTTGVWVRGILRHEYGVDLNKITWCTNDESHLAEYADPSNCRRLTAGSNIPRMLLDGNLAAAILVDAPNDPRVVTLIPNAQAAGEQWHVRTGVVPINHMFVVRQELCDEHPEAVREIYRMLVESRRLAPPADLLTLPPLGVEANRRALQLAIDWSLEQQILPRRLTVEELFHPVSAGLVNPSALP